TGLERDLRDALYEHLQRLHVGFHDRWQSGQMLSRAMGDISTIRRFLAFGLVFLIVCAAQFVLVVALLARLYLPLALLTATAVAPLMLVSASFRRRYGLVTRRVQDQQGDLTTTIEESAVGIRVVKAFRQGRLVGSQFAAGAGQLRETANEGVALRARYFLLLDLVPNLTVAVVLLAGALAVGRGALSLGGLVAFVALVIGMVSRLARLHDPSEGRITLDGRDIRTLALGSLRRQVAMAFEDPLLFSASVRENLLVGHRTSSEGDMRRALHTAQADFVHDLPW